MLPEGGDRGCSVNGSKLDIGFGSWDFFALAYVKDMKPPKLTKIPSTPVKDIGFANTMLVTTIAKIRRIQFKAA